MSQVVICISIQASQSHKQPGYDFNMELEQDTTIQEILEYLKEEDKLQCNIEEVEVLIDQKLVSSEAFVRDFATKNNELVVRIQIAKLKGGQFSTLPQPNAPRGMVLDKSSYDMDVPSAEEIYRPLKDNTRGSCSDFGVTIPSAAEISSEIKLPVPVTLNNYIPAATNYAPKNPYPQNFQPKPAPNQIQTSISPQQPLTVKVKVTLRDGQISKAFNIQAQQIQSFQDIKPRIFQYIIQNNLADDWKPDENVKVHSNAKALTKMNKGFKLIGVINNGCVDISITREFPGGADPRISK